LPVNVRPLRDMKVAAASNGRLPAAEKKNGAFRERAVESGFAIAAFIARPG